MHLADIIKRSSFRLVPESTGAEPLLPKMADLRAIVFDVYGTLFISESGDISLAEQSDREDLMRQAFAHCGVGPAREDTRLVDRFHETVHAFQDKRRAQGIAWPEVEIREVWRALLDDLHAEEVIDGPPPSPARLEELAVTYECLSNRIWPMPGLRETLAAIRERGLLLGIVSNAQFYTPLLFEAFLGATVEELGFKEDCCVWSYREREGKPSTALYEKLAAALQTNSISPTQSLYVGNDVRNDILPSQRTGFKTALFAGDKRSLRLRQDDPECAAIKPDVVVTELGQLLAVAGWNP